MPSLDLKGPQQKQIEAALLAAFPGQIALERVVNRTNRKLSDVVGDQLAGLDRVFKLVEAAQAGGWTTDLLVAALKEQPDNPQLRAVGTQFLSIDQMPSGPAFDSAEPSRFDLTDLEQAFWETVQPAPNAARRLVGFGITYSDDTFVRLLRKRIAGYLGPDLTENWDPYELHPKRSPAAFLVKKIVGVKDKLRAKHNLFVVRADAANAAEVGELWQAVSDAYPGVLENFLMIVILQQDAAEFPAKVVRLPSPSFKYPHLVAWTTQLFAGLATADPAWNPPDAWGVRWSKRIYDDAFDGNALDIRSVYDALEADLKALRANAAAFRESLQD